VAAWIPTIAEDDDNLENLRWFCPDPDEAAAARAASSRERVDTLVRSWHG
jgi:hypothetical protein